jgi:hypothetical protein
MPHLPESRIAPLSRNDNQGARQIGSPAPVASFQLLTVVMVLVLI